MKNINQFISRSARAAACGAAVVLALTLGGRAEVRAYEGVGHMTSIGALSRLLAWKAPVLDDSVAFVRASGAS